MSSPKPRNWKVWLILAAFLLAAGFTGFRVYRTVRSAIYWKQHRDEPIRGWMTVHHIAHSYHVPPQALYQALDVPPARRDKRTLFQIARKQNRSLDDVRQSLVKAIANARRANVRATPSPARLPAKERSR